jgi:uncharacterized MAPEG superfamily protein
MPVELKMLAWSMLLGLVYFLIATTLVTLQRGLAWNASNREAESKPLTGVTGRSDRAFKNFLETFVFFVAAVLAVVVAQRTNASTALGAQLFFWARVVYLPVYLIGIPYLRTLVWAISIAGLLMVVFGLF